MKTFIIRLITVTLIVSVTFSLIFGQAGTCPNGYGNPITQKNCYKVVQNFAERATFQTTVVQKGSATDSATLSTDTTGNTLLAHGNGFALVNNSKGVIGNSASTGYRVAATTDNIQLQQGATDSILINFSGDTVHLNATVSAWEFNPPLNSSSVTGFWKTTGNAGTVSATNFIGTTDAVNFNIVSGNNINVKTDNSIKFKDIADNTLISFENDISHIESDYDSIHFQGAVGIGTGNNIVGDNQLTVFGGFVDSTVTSYGFAVVHVGAFNIGGAYREGIYASNGYSKIQLTDDRSQPNKTIWHYSLGNELSKVEGDSLLSSGETGTGEVRLKFGNSIWIADDNSFYEQNGIGTIGYSANPVAGVYTIGLKLTDGTQGTGKVLTSDANGVASWDYPFTTMTTSKSGDGVAAVVTIAHLLAYTPTFVSAVPTSDDARGLYKITQDATNVYLTYTVAPILGTNNLSYSLLLTK